MGWIYDAAKAADKSVEEAVSDIEKIFDRFIFGETDRDRSDA